MKLNTEQNDIVKIGNFGETGVFNIQASAKAFKILSDGLYTDKIQACIRELSCNAYDSHVAAGKADVPFKVHMPTILEPFFSVQDFGLGLSHDDIMHLYTTYFSSTKTESNDFIGALGLGSKSPFSYVDSFTVESIFEGRLRKYSAYIGEDGSPQITLMMEDMTCDTNGVTVSFPVKKEDINTFSKYGYLFDLFPVEPLNNFQYENKTEVVEEIEGLCRFINNGYLRHHREYYVAIQGSVSYPITMSEELLAEIEKYGDETILKNSHPINVCQMIFPVGSLDVAASREALSYDKQTIEAIAKRGHEAYKAIEAKIQKDIDACLTEWEAYTTAYHLEQAYRGYFNLSTVTYKGKKYDCKKWGTSHLHGTHKFTMYAKNLHDYRFKEVSKSYAAGNITIPQKSDKVPAFIVVTGDVRNYKQRANKYLQDTPEIIRVLTIQPPSFIEPEKLHEFLSGIVEGYHYIMYDRDLPEVERSSSGAPKVKSTVEKTPENLTEYFEIKDTRWYGGLDRCYKPLPDSGGYYVEIKNNHWLRSDGAEAISLATENSYRNFDWITSLKEALGIDTLYGFNQVHMRHIREDSRWKPVNSLITTALEHPKAIEYMEKKSEFDSITDHDRYFLNNFFPIINVLKEIHPELEGSITQIQAAKDFDVSTKDATDDGVKFAHKAVSIHELNISLCRILGKDELYEKKDLTPIHFSDMVSDLVTEKYPLLMSASGVLTDNAEEAKFYINAKKEMENE